jgi:hypothetical protein
VGEREGGRTKDKCSPEVVQLEYMLCWFVDNIDKYN